MKEKTINKLERIIRKVPKTAVVITGNIALGATLGAIGKYTKEPVLVPAIPIALDFIGGHPANWATPFYLGGVALNYIPEIINYFSN